MEGLPGLPGAVLSEDDKLTAFRAYLLGSCALDERAPYSALSRMRPAQGDLDPKNYIYGGAYLYPIGGLILLAKTLGLLHLTTDLPWYLEHPRHIARLYLCGRSLGLLAFLGILVLIPLWSRRLGWGRMAAGLATAAFCLSSLAFWQALRTKPHIYVAFWGLWGLYLLARHCQHGRRRTLWASAFCIGWAAGSFLPSASLCLAYPVFLWRPGPWRAWVGRVAAAWLIVAAVFALTNPYAFLSYETYLLNLMWHTSGQGWGFGVFRPDKAWRFLHTLIMHSYAFPLSLAGLAGLFWALRRGGFPARRLALTALLLAVGVGPILPLPRYTLFLGPVLALMAGGLLATLWQKTRAPRALKASILVGLYLPGLVVLGLNLRDAVWDQAWYAPTRTWLAAGGLGPGEDLGVFELPDPTNLPPLPFLPRRVVNLSGPCQGLTPPAWVAVNNHHWNNRQKWERHRWRRLYRLEVNLGWRRSYDWLLSIRPRSPARVAALIYRRVEPAGGPP
jgi:hypothetical protein